VDAFNPLLQAHPTWARDKHEGRGIPPLTPVSLRLPPPSRSVSRRPIWAGARGDNLLVGPGTPRVLKRRQYYTLLKFYYYFIFYSVYGLLVGPISFNLILMLTVSFVDGLP
jgi:hypothetical protein